GDRAPGFPWYVRLRLLLGPLVNAGGEVLFGATAADARTDPPPTPPRRVLYLASPSGALTQLAIGGQTAPGTNAAFDLITLGTWPQMLFTDSWRLAFRSTLSGPGGSPFGNSGLWAGRPGDIRLVARNGDQVPGFPPGAVYTEVSSYAMNGRGQIVFDA